MRGLTLLYDVRQRKWSTLYGWDVTRGLPARWPGWSCERIWDKTLIGINGAVCELDRAAFDHCGVPQRLLGRTAHFGGDEVRIDNLRLRLRRGVGGNESEPRIMLRCNRDNRGFGPWKRKGLGKRGDRQMTIEFGGYGCGHRFQFEWQVTDPCRIEIAGLDWQATPVGT